MENKVAIVTGAARGIGKAIADKLLEDGFVTICLDLSFENEASIRSDKLILQQCDISDANEVKATIGQIINKYGRIDVLVNNAGIIKDNVIWKMPVEDFDRVLSVNLRGTWLLCKSVGTFMREQRAGRIVNISSRAWLGNPGQTNYAASKAGIIGLTRSLALELGRYGVYVNAIAPGLIESPLSQSLPDDVREKLIQSQPTKSMGQPEDIAHTVSFLCDDRTHFITGQTLYIDGGKSIGAGI